MPDRSRTHPTFLHNVLVLVSGSTVAQVLPIAISPLLTRIYTPDDFGLFALFIAVISIFSSISTGRYELSILLPHDDRHAAQLLLVSLLLASCTAIALLLIAPLIGHQFSEIVGNPALYPWLYLAPPVVFLTALFNALVSYNNRLTRYADIARANIWKSVAISISQLLIGALHASAAGLFLGQAISVVTANLRLSKNAIGSHDLKQLFVKRELRALAYEYRDFPYYSMPAILANVLTQQLATIFIAALFSPTLLGFYSLAQRVLGMPSALVGTSVSQVFFQRLVSVRHQPDQARRVFDRTTIALAFLAAPIFLTIYLIAEPLFTFFFGAEWSISGRYAAILMPLFYVRFVATAVSTTTSAYEKQRLALAWQVGLLTLSLICVAIAYLYNFSIERFLQLYTIIIGAHYIALYLLLRAVVLGRL